MNNYLYSILFSQYVTEKSNLILDKHNHIVFRVSKHSNKKLIKASVEKIFNVLVKSVRIINVKGKIKLFKGKSGKRSDFKKAIVFLNKGYNIKFSEFE
ncbi:MAG: 50S ribosomal protein L23 [Candidatus Azosocius agrarius]|nr:MAG: 50S ribosomal protein L23 [Gammaproteobacteria bacterium]